MGMYWSGVRIGMETIQREWLLILKDQQRENPVYCVAGLFLPKHKKMPGLQIMLVVYLVLAPILSVAGMAMLESV